MCKKGSCQCAGTGSQCMLDLETEKNVLIDGTPLKKFILLQHISDAGSIVRMIAAVYFDETFFRGEKTRNQVEQCRFSTPGGTDQSNKFPFADRKGDVFQGVGFSFQCMVSIMNVFQFQCILHDNPPDTETIISLLLTVYEK